MGSSLSNIFRILPILFQKLAKSMAQAMATLGQSVVPRVTDLPSMSSAFTFEFFSFIWNVAAHGQALTDQILQNAQAGSTLKIT